jgi:mono/diheme cytochrome c family protein
MALLVASLCVIATLLWPVLRESETARGQDVPATHGEDAAPSTEAALLDTMASAPELPADIAQLLAKRCVSCHGRPGAAGLSLAGDDMAASLVDVTSTEVDTLSLVEPGSPERSYLLMKLLGDERIVGRPMPPGGKPISQETLGSLEAWVRGLVSETEPASQDDAGATQAPVEQLPAGE